MAPFFLSYGLLKAAFIGTEACATLVMRVTRIAVYGGLALIDPSAITDRSGDRGRPRSSAP